MWNSRRIFCVLCGIIAFVYLSTRCMKYPAAEQGGGIKRPNFEFQRETVAKTPIPQYSQSTTKNQLEGRAL
jgi:hypothetical protein